MNSGMCYICKSKISQDKMTKHIKNCINRELKATISLYGNNDKTYLLKIEGINKKADYFMYVLIDGCVPFDVLDQYISKTWYNGDDESGFFVIDGVELNLEIEFLSMEDVLKRKKVFKYRLDQKGVSDLKVAVIEIYDGISNIYGIRLISKNLPIEHRCCFCRSEADWFYFDDLKNEKGFLCQTCFENMQNNSKRKNVYYSKIYNSPYMGASYFDSKEEEIKLLKYVDSNSNVDTIDMDIEEYDNFCIDDFEIDITDDYELFDMLCFLDTDALLMICDNLGIPDFLETEKLELEETIEQYILSNLKNIFTFLESDEYTAFMYLMEEENVVIKNIDDIPYVIDDLRKKGLLYTVGVENDMCYIIIPIDIRVKIEKLNQKSIIANSRKTNKKIYDILITMLVYWGIIEKNRLRKEIVKLAENYNDKVLDDVIYKLKLEDELDSISVDGKEYYYFTDVKNPKEIITSQIWKKSEYLNITKEIISLGSGNWVDLMLSNPYINYLYRLLSIGEDIERIIDGEDDTGYMATCELYMEAANLKPGLGTKELVEKLEMDKNLAKLPFIKELMNKVIKHIPNYWKKGNAQSGEIHLYKGKYRFWEPKNPPIF